MRIARADTNVDWSNRRQSASHDTSLRLQHLTGNFVCVCVCVCCSQGLRQALEDKQQEVDALNQDLDALTHALQVSTRSRFCVGP
jgi:hypothetical protein